MPRGGYLCKRFWQEKWVEEEEEGEEQEEEEEQQQDEEPAAAPPLDLPPGFQFVQNVQFWYQEEEEEEGGEITGAERCFVAALMLLGCWACWALGSWCLRPHGGCIIYIVCICICMYVCICA